MTAEGTAHDRRRTAARARPVPESRQNRRPDTPVGSQSQQEAAMAVWFTRDGVQHVAYAVGEKVHGVCGITPSRAEVLRMTPLRDVGMEACRACLFRGEAYTDSEPAPVPNALPPVWNLVIVDMARRDEDGTMRYGTHLQPFNGRDALTDAYQEALDLVVYLRQALYERDGR